MTLEPIPAPPRLFIYLSEEQQEAINGGHGYRSYDVENINISAMRAEPEQQAQKYVKSAGF